MAFGRLGRAFSWWRRLGTRGFAQLVVYRLHDRYWDWRLGIRAAGVQRREDLGLANPAFFDYGPTNYLLVAAAMRRLPLEPGRDVFLDVGSGLGRVVAMAARYPLRKVIGVEIAPALCEAAARNLERARPHLVCRDIELACCDAAAYPIPADVTIIFMYNPFGKDVLARVLENIRRSVAQSPRRLSLIYVNNEVLEQEWGGQEWLVRRGEFGPFGHSAIYEVRPQGRGRETGGQGRD
jgi:SAM-dependent methyltransferase